jgi:hypothetical protein
MTDYIPTAEDVDDAIRHAVNIALAFECSKLTATEHARLKLALASPSEDVEEILDEVMDAMVSRLCECVCSVLNTVALEPEHRDP